MAADRAGNIFVGGQTDGNLFAPAAAGDGQDIWVAKLDGVGGELVWGYQASAERKRNGRISGLNDGKESEQARAPSVSPPPSVFSRPGKRVVRLLVGNPSLAPATLAPHLPTLDDPRHIQAPYAVCNNPNCCRRLDRQGRMSRPL